MITPSRKGEVKSGGGAKWGHLHEGQDGIV